MADYVRIPGAVIHTEFLADCEAFGDKIRKQYRVRVSSLGVVEVFNYATKRFSKNHQLPAEALAEIMTRANKYIADSNAYWDRTSKSRYEMK